MKRAFLFEALLDELEQGALEGDAALTLEQVIDKLDEHLVPLTFAYSTISLLSSAQTEVHKYRLLPEVTKVFNRIRTRRFSIVELYTFLQKQMAESHSTRGRFYRRVAERYLLEGKLNGLEAGKEEVDKVTDGLREKTKEFAANVDRANKEIQDFIVSAPTLTSLPPGFLTSGPRTWTPFDNSVYARFMRSCNDRSIRKKFFDHYNQRCHKKHANSVLVEEIRGIRKDYSLFLGYDNFVALSMETKMAGFVSNARAMLNTMHMRCQTGLQRDLKLLTEFAVSHSQGQVDDLRLWDLDYYQQQFMQTTATTEAAKAMQANFPLDSVLKAICDLCSRLFQVDIVESEQQFPSWHPSVRLFDVFTPNGFHGSFYLDPFARSGKRLPVFAQTHFLLSRSDILGVKPVSALVLSLPAPIGQGQATQLTLADVVRLFGCFGSLLQHTLTEVPLSEVNGLSNLEWDVVTMLPEFMSLWPLYHQATLNECAAASSSLSGGVSSQLQQQVAERYFKFSSISLIQELYKSALDLALHSNTEFWQDIVYEVWDVYMKPFALEKTDFHVCSAGEIVCQSPAACYSSLWSKMVAADLFALVQERMADGGEEAVSQLGLVLRETFLSESGAHPSSEMFKVMRERNPSVDPFLRLNHSCVLYESISR